jgi:hypothetical protein
MAHGGAVGVFVDTHLAITGAFDRTIEIHARFAGVIALGHGFLGSRIVGQQ